MISWLNVAPTTPSCRSKKASRSGRPYATAPGEPPREVVYRTTRMLERLGATGFDSPLHDHFRGEVAGFYAGTDAARRRVLELEAIVAHREREIDLMKQSRFWKLRDGWFRVKRAVGLERSRP